ncbi:MAG: hypothetical protein PVF91_00750 [Chromatiales bacterium]
MARKTFVVRCAPGPRRVLCEAVRGFADAAYPPGGSDCAQAARAALLGVAEALKSTTAPETEVSVRVRAMLKSAVRWHFEQMEQATCRCAAQQRALALAALAGEAISDADLRDAAARDAAAPGAAIPAAPR